MARSYLLLLSAVWMVACAGETEREALPDWSDWYESDGTGAPDAGGEPDAGGDLDTDGEASRDTELIQEGKTEDLPEHAFGIGIPESVDYPYRLRELGTIDSPCVAGGQYKPEVTCILEVNELDLWVLGFAYDVVTPKGLCDFVTNNSYIFKNRDWGEGPTEVTIIRDTSKGKGADAGDFDPDTDVDAGVDKSYIVEETNARNGIPYCEFDYSPDGPNCCFGRYSMTVTNRETNESVTTLHDWGGRISNCYDGGAFLREGVTLNKDGWPDDVYQYVERESSMLTVRYKGPSYPRHGFPSTIYLANYYDPVDHDDDMPWALRRSAGAQPTYMVECTDDADEMIARLHLIVREWNLEAEFDIDGTPDSEGYEEFWGGKINDYWDFKDRTPGKQAMPNLPARDADL